MDAIAALKTRRCIRAYTAEPVAQDVIEDIIDCARLAATARNEQPWEFVVVTKREVLRRIADLAEYGKFIAQAAACVVILCRDTKYYLEDGSSASQNILLAARAHGLGACWVAGDKKSYAEIIRREIGAPQAFKVISLIPFGYPAESPHKRKRLLSEVLHWEKF
jgi:nitroreductase